VATSVKVRSVVEVATPATAGPTKGLPKNNQIAGCARPVHRRHGGRRLAIQALLDASRKSRGWQACAGHDVFCHEVWGPRCAA
jgi:hypothetical protein